MRRSIIGAGILGIALLNFFQFPGHTWLQSDTQIYAPILEHRWDPSVLQKDLIVQHPHVAFTLYDESAVALRWLTRLSFRDVLQSEQFLLRVLAIWGAYLIATALGLPGAVAFFMAAVFSLGATIMGPAVLVFEYEPVPRGFAISLVVLAIGFIAHSRYLAAGIAASLGLLFHPPTVLPFWAVYLCLALWPSNTPAVRKRLSVLWLLALAAMILFAVSRFEARGGETQAFFSRLDAAQEQLQRMRASYNWVSIWVGQWLPHYLTMYFATLLAYWRIRNSIPRALSFFLVGLPLFGIVSIPISYVLLEKLRWALIPQVQPTRTLLFVTGFAMLLSTAAAWRAIEKARYVEAFAWLLIAYISPLNRVIQWLPPHRLGVLVVLTALAAVALWAVRKNWRWSRPLLLVAAVMPFLLIPTWGRMRNYRPLHSSELADLSDWARRSTPKDAVFLFPDAGQDLYPGVFRAEATRAVYVDWKTGGQVNFFKGMGDEWWARWQRAMAAPFDTRHLPPYGQMGIDFIAVQARNRIAGAPPVYTNAKFIVYAVPALLLADLNVDLRRVAADIQHQRF